ncbi:MAG: hypothetical protein AABY03_02525 [Nanoarchaeota archaeon]
MIYTTVEWLALLIAVLSLVKIATLMIKPKIWINFSAKLWKKPKVTGIVALILSVAVLYFLLQEMTIVQIFATALFFKLLLIAGSASYAKDLLSIKKKNIKKIIKESRFFILIFLLLIIWVLWEIFKY